MCYFTDNFHLYSPFQLYNYYFIDAFIRRGFIHEILIEFLLCDRQSPRSLVLEFLRWINTWSLCTSSVAGARQPKARVIGDEAYAMEGEAILYRALLILKKLWFWLRWDGESFHCRELGRREFSSVFYFHRIIWVFCHYYIWTRQGQKPRSYGNNLSET